jgi:hypothetical protein
MKRLTVSFLQLPVAAWNRFWFAGFDPFSVGLFRIALGGLLVAFFVASGPNWDRFYSAEGLLSLDILDPARQSADRLNVFYWTESLFPVRVWWFVGLAAAFAFMVGLGTRLATFLLYGLVASMVHRSPMVVNGEDLVFRMVLFYGCFAPLGHCLSLDSLRRSRRCGSVPERSPSAWAVRLLQLNFALIYAISLPYKLFDDAAWTDGTAIYWAMTSNVWSRWAFPEVLYGSPLIAALTYGTILVEGAFPMLVWFQTTRLAVIAALAVLHLGIAVFLQNVTFFSLAMVCVLWVFVPADTATEWLCRISGRFRRGGNCR